MECAQFVQCEIDILPRYRVSGHEGSWLSYRHQVVGGDHARVGATNEAAGHSLGPTGVLSLEVLSTLLMEIIRKEFS